MSRYMVAKASGSRYAYVVDTHYSDERIHRFDILKDGGWEQAEKCCERMNRQTEEFAAAKADKHKEAA